MQLDTNIYIPVPSKQKYYNQQILGKKPLVNIIHSKKKVETSLFHQAFGGNIAIISGYRYREDMKAEVVKEIKSNKWVAHEMNITVNGHKIDFLLVGDPKQINNGRWVLYSNPNGNLYEEVLGWGEIQERIDGLKTNYLFYNYPGTGQSQGETIEQNCIDTYKAMLSFLENKICAREIIGWGTSIGGGIQGAALTDYPFKKDISYVFVPEQTFSCFEKVPEKIMEEFVGKSVSDSLNCLGIGAMAKSVVQCAEWVLDSRKSSRQLEKQGIPEIIIQKTIKDVYTPTHMKEIVGDGMISHHASKAAGLLKEKSDWENKVFIGVQVEHLGRYDEFEESMIQEVILQKLHELNEKKIEKLLKDT